jgi:hypothetical protein
MSPAAPGRRRRRVRRPVAFGLALVVLCAVAIPTVLTRSDDSQAGMSAKDGYVGAMQADAASCKTVVQRSRRCPNKQRFDPPQFVHHGNAFTCDMFARQADAQAVLRAAPGDPNNLDPDRDGIACPQLPAPSDHTPVAASVARFKCVKSSRRSARCPQPNRRFVAAQYVAYGVDEFDCSAFASQADAQAVLRYSPQDPNVLDGDEDGIACPDLPAPKDLHPVQRTPPS